MRRLLFPALIVALAVPAMAQRVQPVLPFAPRGMDYVESVCTGGFDGRYEQTRILTNGQVSTMNGLAKDVPTVNAMHKAPMTAHPRLLMLPTAHPKSEY